MDVALGGLVWYVVFLFSTSLHEAAHAWAAKRGGDPTAYHAGQVSLDPRAHVRREPFGMLVLPLFTALSSGWPIGYASAPYDPRWAAAHPRRAAWMALAGPGANLLLVVAAGGLVWLGIAAGVFAIPDSVTGASLVAPADSGVPTAAAARLVSALFTLNLILCLFNLLPLPPLDGSNALPLVLPPRAVAGYQALLRQPVLAIGGILLAWTLFGPVFRAAFGVALSLLYPGAF